MNGRAVWAIARADFLERARRYSFLLTLLFAVFLGYETAAGKILIQLDDYRGVYTSGWIGALMAMVITCFVSLIGFYIVKNCVERDRMTGVGAILASTPLNRPAYAVGKWLSNFAVLATIVAILAVTALVMQFVAAEDPHINLWALLSPFLLLALPAMAVTAALALCFEMLPGLRGGIGNVVWFFAWIFLLSLPMIKKMPWLDPIGLATVMRSLSAEAKQAIPGYHGGMAFQIAVGQPVQVAENLRWVGVAWHFSDVLLRLSWVAVACVMVTFVSQLFDRFDNVARMGKESELHENTEMSVALAETAASRKTTRADYAAQLILTGYAPFWSAFLHMVLAELRLALKGCRWWWYAVAAGLLVAQFASPLSAARGPLLACAWIWPALLWSHLGTRELKCGTQQILSSCPGILRRQLPASWLAGILIALFTGLGAGVRLLVAGDWPGWLAWGAAAVFVPSLALALGTWSGANKFFEGLYTGLWYVGPMNHSPGLDYTGSSNGSNTPRYAVVYFACGIALFCVACLRRKTQLNSR